MKKEEGDHTKQIIATIRAHAKLRRRKVNTIITTFRAHE